MRKQFRLNDPELRAYFIQKFGSEADANLALAELADIRKASSRLVVTATAADVAKGKAAVNRVKDDISRASDADLTDLHPMFRAYFTEYARRWTGLRGLVTRLDKESRGEQIRSGPVRRRQTNQNLTADQLSAKMARLRAQRQAKIALRKEGSLAG